MHKLWLVAKHEYLKMVRRRSFWLGTLGVPLLIVVVMAVSIAVAVGGGDGKPLGYVDQAGLLADEIYPPDKGDDFSTMLAFPDEAAARAALENGDIQAFYIVPQDYMQSLQMTLYYWDDPPGEGPRDDFDDFMRANLASNLPGDVRQRLLEGIDLTMRSADGRREAVGGNLINFFMPFVAGMFFVFSVMASAGYLLQAVTDEKENRTVEIIFTSLTPEQIIGGKAVGLISVALSQLLVWVLTVVLGLIIGARFVELLRAIEVPWDFVLVVAVYFLPAYALIAGMMTAIGGMVTDMQQGRQISGVLNMLFVLPFFFTAMAFADPNSPILVALTLFPTTAFVTITLRWGATVIPAWQLILSWLLLVASAVLSVWASARVFRVGMLRYGQRLDFRAAFKVIRGR